MAETIGGIKVEIIGDYSDLVAKLQEAQSLAAAAGQQIAAALTSGADGADKLASSVAESMGRIADSAKGAADGITTAFAGISIAPLDTSAVDASLSSVVDTAGSAAAMVTEFFASAQLAAPDASPVETALSGVVDQAQAAGEELAASTGVVLDSPDASGAVAELGSVPDAAQAAADEMVADFGQPLEAPDVTPVTDAFAAVDSAAGEAKPPIEGVNEEIGHTGEKAHEASGGLGSMSEQLLALGEALAVTEALKEFGAEALHAADNVTHASIALTALTGDAEKTETTIKGLEEIGTSEGLAFPSLLTAATRMQNILGPTTDVTAIIGKLGDSAGVTGKDIGAAADAFDRIVASGNTATKPLQALGLTAGDLAKAMGDASLRGDDLKQAFKSLSDEGKIDVLSTALGKFQGIAADVASKTFGGQWQILANQWDAVMVQIGNAILPVITDLTNFAKTDILPFVKTLVDGFNSLPGPVKDVAVAVGIAAAAIVPLTAGLAAFGLAMTGLQEAGVLFTGLLTSIGIAAPAAASGETAAAAATTALGEAAASADVALAGLAIPLGAVALAVVSLGAGAVIAWSQLQEGLAPLQSLNDAFESFLILQASEVTTGAQAQAAQEALNKAIDAGAISADAAKIVQGYLNDAMVQQGINLESVTGSWLKLSKAQQEAIGSSFKSQIDDFGISIKGLSDKLTDSQVAAEGSRAKFETLSDAVDKAKTAMDKAVQTYHDTGEGADKAAAASDKYQAAVKALQSAHEALLPVLTTVRQATKAFVDVMDNIPGEEEQATLATDAHIAKLTSLSSELVHAQALLSTVAEQYGEGTKTAADFARAQDNVNTIQEKLNKTLGDAPTIGSILGPEDLQNLTNADNILAQLNDSVSKAPPYVRTAASAWKDLGIELDDINAYDQKLIDSFDKILTDEEADLPSLKEAWSKIRDEIKALAEDDLPAAQAEYDKYIQKLKDTDAPLHTILATETQMREMERDWAFERSDDWGKYQVAVDIAKTKQEALYDSSTRLVAVYQDVKKVIGDTFKDFESAISTAIVDGKNLGDTLEAAGKKIAKEFIDDVLNLALKPVENSLKNLIGSLFPSVIQGAGGASGAITTLGGAAGTAASQTTQLGSSAASAGSAASSVGGAFGSLGATVNVVSGAVSAVTGVIGVFQQATANASLKLIELNTRITAIEVGQTRQDDWTRFVQEVGEWTTTMDVMTAIGTNEFSRLGDIWNAIRELQQHVDLVGDGIYQLGHGQMSAPTAAVTANISGATVMIGGQAITDLNGIWTDANLMVEGLRNIAIDIQATASATTAAGPDWRGIFDASYRTAGNTAATTAATTAAAANTAATTTAVQATTTATNTVASIVDRSGRETVGAVSTIHSSIDTVASNVDRAGRETVGAVNSAIDRARENTKTITTSVDTIASTVERSGREVVGAVKTSGDAVSSVIDRTGRDSVTSINESRDAVASAVDRSGRSIVDSQQGVIDGARQNTKEITTSLTTVNSTVDRTGRDVAGAVKTSQDDIHSIIDRSGRDAVTAIDTAREHIGSSVDRLGQAVAGTTAAVNAARDHIGSAVDRNGQTVAGAVTALADHIDAVARAADNVASTVDRAGRNVAGTVNTTVPPVGLATTTAGANVTAAVTTGAATMSGTTAGTVPPIVAAITAGAAATASTIMAGVAITAAQLVALQAALAAVGGAVNPVTGNTPPGTFPGETYGSDGSIIPPAWYFNQANIQARQDASILMQEALAAGNAAAFATAAQAFMANSGGSLPAWVTPAIIANLGANAGNPGGVGAGSPAATAPGPVGLPFVTAGGGGGHPSSMGQQSRDTALLPSSVVTPPPIDTGVLANHIDQGAKAIVAAFPLITDHLDRNAAAVIAAFPLVTTHIDDGDRQIIAAIWGAANGVDGRFAPPVGAFPGQIKIPPRPSVPQAASFLPAPSFAAQESSGGIGQQNFYVTINGADKSARDQWREMMAEAKRMSPKFAAFSQ